MRKLAIIASLLVTAVAVCAEATQADASRKATRSERAAILHELRITRDDPLPYPKGSYRYFVSRLDGVTAIRGRSYPTDTRQRGRRPT